MKLTLIIPTDYLRQQALNKSKHYHIANNTEFIVSLYFGVVWQLYFTT